MIGSVYLTRYGWILTSQMEVLNLFLISPCLLISTVQRYIAHLVALSSIVEMRQHISGESKIRLWKTLMKLSWVLQKSPQTGKIN